MNRLIACLDVQGGRVVKGTRFVDLRDVGDPSEMAVRYEAEGADEIIFLDISASTEERDTVLEMATQTAEQLFIPLTLGGGVRSVGDVMRALRSGADKVSINSAGVERPQLLRELADRFGSQCVVASIDSKQVRGNAHVCTRGGTRLTELDTIEWAVECATLGAGEILLTSIDRDGSRSGYDLDLTRRVSEAVDVPVIASGGAGSAEDVVAAFTDGHADAALVAGVLHERLIGIREIKTQLARAGVPVRMTP